MTTNTGGTGVEQTTARFDSHIEVAAERAVEKAIANYPGEPRGELTITVTVTDK